MEINISAKHLTIEEDVKQKATSLITKFAEGYPNQKITSARILFSAERNWQIVEILVNAKNLNLHAAGKADSVYAALSSAVAKIDTQMGRYLAKVRDNSVKADPSAKDKIWRASELKEQGDDADLGEYEYEYEG